MEKNDINKLLSSLDNDDNMTDKINYMILQELLNYKKLKAISRISKTQVPILSKLYLFTETFKIGFTKKIADNILQLQISIAGLGRKELVQMFSRNEQQILENSKIPKDIFR